MEKCTTEENIGDLGTKALDEKRHNYLVKKLGMANLEDYRDESRVASIGHGLHLAGGNQGAIFIALGVLFQAIGANAVRASAEDLQDDLVDIESSWWPLQVIMIVFLLGAFCGSCCTWKLMESTQKQTNKKGTQTCVTYTWWTKCPRFVIRASLGDSLFD